jgi:hypothetical protein
MTDEPLTDRPTPPCIICGKPGVTGVGAIGRPDETWYCRDHDAEAMAHVAQPVPGWPIAPTPRRKWWRHHA